MKKLLFVMGIIALTGGSCNYGYWTSLSGGKDDGIGADLILDNDVPFDLFSDDFGTGTEYDDLFIEDGQGNVAVGDTNISAGGDVTYGDGSSYTYDPVFDNLGQQTPDELHKQQLIEIPVLIMGGNVFIPFPEKQFGEMAHPDLCDHPHYHGDSGYSLERQTIPEPDGPCGFDNATKILNVTGDEMIEWFHNRPRNF